MIKEKPSLCDVFGYERNDVQTSEKILPNETLV